MYDHGGEKMSIKMKLERIGAVALIAILVTVTVIGFTAINPEVINGMLG